VALEEAHLETALGTLDIAPAQAVPSMQRDIEGARPSELDAQTGAIVTMGLRHGVRTPVNDVLYRCLLPQERRARGKLSF
jgi:2-dehydropantoate 2-reductase